MVCDEFFLVQVSRRSNVNVLFTQSGDDLQAGRVVTHDDSHVDTPPAGIDEGFAESFTRRRRRIPPGNFDPHPFAGPEDEVLDGVKEVCRAGVVYQLAHSRASAFLPLRHVWHSPVALAFQPTHPSTDASELHVCQMYSLDVRCRS